MSQLNEFLKATGIVTATVFDSTGKEKYSQTFSNLVVTAGLNFITARLTSTATPTEMTHMGLGTSTDGTVAGDTSLKTPLGSRVAVTGGKGVVTNNTLTFGGTFTGLDGNVSEAGVFNASTSGTMLCRTVFTPIPLTSTDTLTISWTVTIG